MLEGLEMQYEFTDDFLTGIDFIDAEHRHLFEIANEAYELLNNQFVLDKYDEIVAILKELVDYTKTHFAHEEEYMERINYSKIWSQKIQHKKFIERLDAVNLEKIDDTQQQSLLELVDFLATWLTRHIKGMDTKIPAEEK